jgi:hypothetical protein
VLPNFEETLAYLDTARSAELLYTRFSLAHVLAINVVSRSATPTDPGEQPLLPSATEGIGELQQYLLELTFDENLRTETFTIIQELKDDFFPTKANEALIYNFALALAEVEINPEAGFMPQVIGSLAHADRIAAAKLSAGSGSYLCRIFPFSRWCGD